MKTREGVPDFKRMGEKHIKCSWEEKAEENSVLLFIGRKLQMSQCLRVGKEAR